MTNADFWKQIDRIISGGFTSEGLQMLDYYAELFINRRLVYKRFSPFEQHGCATGGATHVIASLLAGAKARADRGAAPYSDDIYLSDMHDENVIRSREGNIFVVDCDIRINVPELKAGGTRAFSTDIEMTNTCNYE